jgi:RNA polymerase sigma-70 factor (ECF subfamily)
MAAALPQLAPFALCPRRLWPPVRSQLGRGRRMTGGQVSDRPPLRAPQLTASTALGFERAPERATSSTRDEGAAPDFERIYTEHFHHVSRWARAFGGLDADLDDLTQEVFLVVRRRLPDYRGPSLSAWLYGITRKTVSDYRRRAWLRRVLGGFTRSLDATPELASRSEVDPDERLEARRVMARVLERMSPRRRAAFVLFEIEGYSGQEIAELEQIPLATAYTRLHHARKDFLRLVAEIRGLAPEEPPP